MDGGAGNSLRSMSPLIALIAALYCLSLPQKNDAGHCVTVTVKFTVSCAPPFPAEPIAVVVAYGFSRTIDRRLIHPALPRPGLLYVHAVIFFGWLVFYILQSALVRTRNVRIHKTLGWFGVALGATIIVLGISTALTMGRYHLHVQHHSLTDSNIGVPLFDITCFAVTFTLSMLWRNRPEFHRRLILLASAALSAAGWARFPLLPPGTFYLGVDVLILLGIARDLVVSRRAHKVYVYGIAAFFVGQVLLIALEAFQPHSFQRFMQLLLG
jgi:hypothetical protein